MLKDKDTSMSGRLGIGCDEDLNTTEKADSETVENQAQMWSSV